MGHCAVWIRNRASTPVRKYTHDVVFHTPLLHLRHEINLEGHIIRIKARSVLMSRAFSMHTRRELYIPKSKAGLCKGLPQGTCVNYDSYEVR